MERDAISMAASEREHSCQGSKDVEKNSQNLSGRSIDCIERNHEAEHHDGDERKEKHLARPGFVINAFKSLNAES